MGGHFITPDYESLRVSSIDKDAWEVYGPMRGAVLFLILVPDSKSGERTVPRIRLSLRWLSKFGEG